MPTRTLRARWVVTMADPDGIGVLSPGEVVLEGSRIIEARPASSQPLLPGDEDFGNAIILPGLINAHTHIEYTVLRGMLEDIDFFPWIRELTARKAALTQEDWEASAVIGAAEAVSGGTTTLADCTDSGAALFGAKTCGMRGIIYQEVFGIDGLMPVTEIVNELKTKVEGLKTGAQGSNLAVGISPHAPYTVSKELFITLAEFAKREHLPVCIHAAESQAEVDLIARGTGPIAKRFAERGIQWDAPGGTTVEYLHQCGLVRPGTLLVHGVHITKEDAALTGETGCAWVISPKSNAKLGNGIPPWRHLKRQARSAKPLVGLGTDSVVSNNGMDLFEEMRFIALGQRAAMGRFDAMTAADALRLATLGGAHALGMEREIGSLEPGKAADLAVVSLNHVGVTPTYDPVSVLVYSATARDVAATYIGGDCIYRDGELQHFDLNPWRTKLEVAQQKLIDFAVMQERDS